jgi:hypothetical protein
METTKVVPLKGQAEESKPADEPISISKPGAFDINRFKSKRSSAQRVDALQTVLPVHRASDAKDFIRLHPDEEYWSEELCFVNVPIHGQPRDTLHLIAHDLADLPKRPGYLLPVGVGDEAA